MLHYAAWYPLDAAESHSMAYGQPDTRMLSWDQSDVADEQYQFNSEREATTSIKSAARVFGAVRKLLEGNYELNEAEVGGRAI